MAVALANIIAFAGGVILIAGLLWAALKGNGDREDEQAAREFYTLNGHWPDEAAPVKSPPPPR